MQQSTRPSHDISETMIQVLEAENPLPLIISNIN